MDISATLGELRLRMNVSSQRLAQILGVSLVSVDRWERGASIPGPMQMQKIAELYQVAHGQFHGKRIVEPAMFLSRGIRGRLTQPSLFGEQEVPAEVQFAATPFPPILSRLTNGRFFWVDGYSVQQILQSHASPSYTVQEPPAKSMSAGKNTYTYDAHTYHTKVPPQGIAELLKHYLPDGGLVLDPFAGSGMTGVACRVLGYDCILNELSPAACFIASRFLSFISPSLFQTGVDVVLDKLQELRKRLYTTICRECGKPTEILYVIWSYRVVCNVCQHEFLLWDHCRSYGKRVRDHKILKEFPCPACQSLLKKSRLKRTTAEPVQIGYMCCGSRQKECFRVLRRGHWLLLVFMNSSQGVWDALRSAVTGAGFTIRKVDIFDKQHGTFKQFVSVNTAGYDLVLHCWKPIEVAQDRLQQAYDNELPEEVPTSHCVLSKSPKEDVLAFLREVDLSKRTNVYLHVDREEEIDFRKLYSEWTARAIIQGTEIMNFALFRSIVEECIQREISQTP